MEVGSRRLGHPIVPHPRSVVTVVAVLSTGFSPTCPPPLMLRWQAQAASPPSTTGPSSPPNLLLPPVMPSPPSPSTTLTPKSALPSPLPDDAMAPVSLYHAIHPSVALHHHRPRLVLDYHLTTTQRHPSATLRHRAGPQPGAGRASASRLHSSTDCRRGLS
jgi:hypothetical protein